MVLIVIKSDTLIIFRYKVLLICKVTEKMEQSVDYFNSYYYRQQLYHTQTTHCYQQFASQRVT